MELKKIVEQQAAFTYNSGYEVVIMNSHPWVDIVDMETDETVIFLESHEAQAFIEEAEALADSADLPHSVGYEALAKAHIESLI